MNSSPFWSTADGSLAPPFGQTDLSHRQFAGWKCSLGQLPLFPFDSTSIQNDESPQEVIINFPLLFHSCAPPTTTQLKMVLAVLRDNVAAFGLFDTLVPIASILTVSGLTVAILPKHEVFGLFLVVWWLMAVMISLQDQIFANPTQWSAGDWRGLVLLLGVPLGILGILYSWFQRSPSVRLLLRRDCPLWCLFAIHVYRLDGLSILWPLWTGNIPKYLGLQTILLDVLIGASSIPLLWTTYRHGVGSLLLEDGGWRRHGIWLWNSLGLYDLVSAYVLLAMNFAPVGGGAAGSSSTFITDPSLAVVGFHPIPLIVLFQAPLAIGTHVMMLNSMDVIIQKQGCMLPLHARIERVRGRKS